MPEDEKDDETAGTDGGEHPEVMTVKQAADYLQVSEQVLYRYVREGKVPVARMGTTIRFKRSVVDAWLERESWESVGIKIDSAGAPHRTPEPSRPRMPMELD